MLHREHRFLLLNGGTDSVLETQLGVPVMRKLVPVISCVVATALAGCSIHPIPYDVPGYRTIDIVRKIRCEAKRALDRLAPTDPRDLAVYDAMTIGYKFTFTITENNKLGASADVQWPLSKGTFTLGIAGAVDKERLGIRDFTFIDTFKEARKESVCTLEATGPNYIYPITGFIGLDEVIYTFQELQSIGLGELPPWMRKEPLPPRRVPYAGKQPKKGDKASSGEKGTAEFVETFDFTTTISGGLSPKVELKAIGTGPSLVKASGDLSGKRMDKHTLIVTLAPNYSAALASLYSQDVVTRLRRIESFTRFVPIQ